MKTAVSQPKTHVRAQRVGSSCRRCLSRAFHVARAAAVDQVQSAVNVSDAMVVEDFDKDAWYQRFNQLLDATPAQHLVGDIVNGTVLSVDQRGAYIDINTKMPATCPTTEATMAKISQVTEVLVPGTTRDFEVVRIADSGTYIVSLRRMEERAAWQRVRQLQECDATVTADVLSSNNGGFLVQFLGIPGFVPSSHISTGVVRENLVGNSFEVKILEADQDKGRLVMSNRRADSKVKLQKFRIGDVVEGTVTKVTYFGAFLDIGGGVNGLLHISQISHDLVTNVERVVQPGDKLKVIILSHDKEKGRVALSTKKLEPTPGDMIRDPALVYERADEMAAKFRELVAAAEAAARAEDARLQGQVA